MRSGAETLALRPIPGPSAFGGGPRRTWDLLWLTSVTDFRLRYKNTLLGYSWSVLKPFLFFGTIYLVVSQVLRFGGEVKHYPLLLILNLVIFQYFQETTSLALRSISSKEPMLRKMQFPRIVIPLSVSLSSAISLLFNLIGVFGVFLVAGLQPRASWLLLPLVLLALIVLTTAAAMFLSVAFVRLEDVGQGWTLFLRVLFYATPILYPLDIDAIPDSLRPVLAANPLSPLLEQARIWVLDPSAPTTVDLVGGLMGLAVPLLIGVAVCVSGFWLFTREAPRVAEAL